MRKGFDVDGVIAAFGEYFLEYLNIPDRTPPSMWDDPRFLDNMHLVKYDQNFWLNIPPLINPKILEGHVELYCTARDIDAAVTSLWLLRNGFPNSTSVLSVGLGKSKVSYLKGRVDAFLDDSVKNFEELNAAGINCYLYTRSHNVDYKTEKRIDRIEDFLAL